jgi:hypothetical protein
MKRKIKIGIGTLSQSSVRFADAWRKVEKGKKPGSPRVSYLR